MALRRGSFALLPLQLCERRAHERGDLVQARKREDANNVQRNEPQLTV